MKHLQPYPEDKIEYKSQQRMNYDHPDGGSMRFAHEYFSIRFNKKIVSTCLVVFPNFRDDEWVTSAGVTEVFEEKDGKFVMIYDVKSRTTGRGWGRILILRLVAYLKSKGFRKMYLDVDFDNFGAQRFYERLGFKILSKYGRDWRYSLEF